MNFIFRFHSLVSRTAATLGRSCRDPARLVIVFAASVLAIIWAGIAFETYEDRADAVREWTTNLNNLNRSFVEHTQRALTAVDHDLQLVRTQYQIYGTDLDLTNLTRQNVYDNSLYRQIDIVDASGANLLSSGKLRPGPAGTRNDFRNFSHGRKDEVSIGRPTLDEANNIWSMELSRRITAPDGSFNGMVVASVNPNYIGALYKEVDLEPESIVSLVGDDGIVRIRRMEGKFSLGDDISRTPAMTKFRDLAAGSYIGRSQRDGMDRLFTFRRLSGYPLTLIVAAPLDRVYERSIEQRKGYLAIGVIASGIIIFFAYIISKQFRQQARTMEELRESRRLAESANQLKSEFLSNMSHELRTPLAGILGFADIIERKSQDEKSRRHGALIHQSGQHLLALLNSLLDLAKIEAGKMDLYAGPEDVAALTRGVTQLHGVTAAGKGLTLQTIFVSQLPREIVCDGTRLRQILNNLLSNAVKFTEQGGIVVSVGLDEFNPAYVLFSVRDTGMGIASELQQHVFEKFTQADGSATRAHQGSGLGLSLTRQLVLLMGGEIGLVSAPGQGTTIHFTLPVRTSGQSKAVTQSPEPALTSTVVEGTPA